MKMRVEIPRCIMYKKFSICAAPYKNIIDMGFLSTQFYTSTLDEIDDVLYLYGKLKDFYFLTEKERNSHDLYDHHIEIMEMLFSVNGDYKWTLEGDSYRFRLDNINFVDNPSNMDLNIFKTHIIQMLMETCIRNEIDADFNKNAKEICDITESEGAI